MIEPFSKFSLWEMLRLCMFTLDPPKRSMFYIWIFSKFLSGIWLHFFFLFQNKRLDPDPLIFLEALYVYIRPKKKICSIYEFFLVSFCQAYDYMCIFFFSGLFKNMTHTGLGVQLPSRDARFDSLHKHLVLSDTCLLWEGEGFQGLSQSHQRGAGDSTIHKKKNVLEWLLVI